MSGPSLEEHLSALWTQVAAQFNPNLSVIHGPVHWSRVEANGLRLAQRTGADVLVIRLFALFHDSRRENDDHDPDHGRRGADFAKQVLAGTTWLKPEQLHLLLHACRGHAGGTTHRDPTIGTCWDADRLDLGRIGVAPHESYMSTGFGKEVARAGTFLGFIQSGIITDTPHRRVKTGL
jgi:uncharacterized protein